MNNVSVCLLQRYENDLSRLKYEFLEHFACISFLSIRPSKKNTRVNATNLRNSLEREREREKALYIHVQAVCWNFKADCVECAAACWLFSKKKWQL
jgi:hypothetical protein